MRSKFHIISCLLDYARIALEKTLKDSKSEAIYDDGLAKFDIS